MFATGPRVAHASRMRDPHFNAAVFGNSTLQNLHPERLNAPTGLRFAQLTVVAAGPMEQAALIRHMIWRRGDALMAVVVGIDYTWCDPARAMAPLNPFPFWLYSTSELRYATGLFRMDSVEALPRRLAILRGKEAPARPDGFWDYEATANQPDARPPADRPVPDALFAEKPPHSAAGLLAAVLAELPAATQAVLVFPPIFVPAKAGEPPRDRLAKERCKAEVMAAARRRPGTIVIDRWVDDAVNRDPQMFLDFNHYRAPLARAIEAEIAQKLTAARP
jgi:hypothetical protein